MKNQTFCCLAFIVFLSFALSTITFSQEKDSTCRVLLKEISGKYKGSCKSGLADGKGSSSGEDTYIGKFLNGLPEGKGVYTYENGNTFRGNFKNGLKDGKGEFTTIIEGKKNVITGYWKAGDYKGAKMPGEDCRITNFTGIEYYSIKKTEDSSILVQISIEQLMKKHIPADLTITLSSGNFLQQNLKILLLNYQLPLNCELHFTKQRNGIRIPCNLSFNILSRGKFDVFISNN